jgi:DNA-binding NtrC family response regulator
MMHSETDARVLLVDDEDEFLETLSERLKIRGLSVVTASTGAEAINKAEQQDFDAIIVDLSMPGLDGIETTQRIKAISPATEIIILTGHGSVQSGVNAMKQGASDFLQKPVELGSLLEKIGEAKSKRMIVLQKESQLELDSILRNRGW